jgi:mannose-6-phosphate isomerase-like protein (cupin superfamily)
MAKAQITRPDELDPIARLTRNVFLLIPPGYDHHVSMGLVFMEPGGIMTPEHYHTEQTEIYFVLRGSGVITLDGEDRELGPYEVVTVPPGVSHIWRNPHKTPLEYLWVMAPPMKGQTILTETPDH